VSHQGDRSDEKPEPPQLHAAVLGVRI